MRSCRDADQVPSIALQILVTRADDGTTTLCVVVLCTVMVCMLAEPCCCQKGRLPGQLCCNQGSKQAGVQLAYSCLSCARR
jgi:hypothetical protein